MSIATELTKLKARRDSIVSAITDKGGTCEDEATLAECATAIGTIPSGGGDTDTYNPAPLPTTLVSLSGYSNTVATNDNIKIYADNGNSYTVQEWHALSGKGDTIKPIGWDISAWGNHFIWFFKCKYRDTDRTYYDVSGSKTQTDGKLRHSQWQHPLITSAYTKTDLNGTTATAVVSGDTITLSTTNSPKTWIMKTGCGGVNAMLSNGKQGNIWDALVAQTEWFRHRCAIDSGLTTTEADGTEGVVTIVTEDDGEMYFYVNGTKTDCLAKYNIHLIMNGDNPTSTIIDAIYEAQKTNGTNMNASCENGDTKPVLTEGCKGAEAYAYNGKWMIVTPVITRANASLTMDYNIPDAPVVYYMKYLRELYSIDNVTNPTEQMLQGYWTNKNTILSSMLTYLNNSAGGSCGISALIDTDSWSVVRSSGSIAWCVFMGSGYVYGSGVNGRCVGVGVSAL